VNVAFVKKALEVANIYFGAVENARRQCTVNIGISKNVEKVVHFSGTAGSYQRDVAANPNQTELHRVVTFANAILIHAIQYHLTRTSFLSLAHPIYGRAHCGRRLVRITGVLVDVVSTRIVTAIDAQDDALGAESLCEFCDEIRVCQSWRVYGYLVSSFVEYLLGIADAADAAGNAEGDIDDGSNPVDPGPVHAAPVGAGSDVVEYELVGTFCAITLRKFNNVAHDPVIAKLHAFDHLSIAYIQTRDYPFCWNDNISAVLIVPSSNARPVIAAGIPSSRSCSRS